MATRRMGVAVEEVEPCKPDGDDGGFDEAELDEAELDEAELDEAELDEAELDEARLDMQVSVVGFASL